MKILRAIGGVFVKIWRWIKNTAWVQPLLIVGAIFGVIFSIPAISNGIQNLINGANSADTFYHNFQKSMDGGEKSDADKLFYNYRKYQDSYEKAKEEGKPWDYKIVPPEERKFLLMFTSTNNANTKDIKAGYEVLRDNWGSGSYFHPVNAGEEFKLYTIFTDEETDETKPHESAFSQFLSRHYSFFENASDVGLTSNYFLNGKLTEDDLNNLANPDPSNFKIPTIILVDWIHSEKVYGEEGDPGITEVMFDVPGDNSYAKASLLYDCWNFKGDFSSNPER